jgi:MYXO-CTERM domain-containing protein
MKLLAPALVALAFVAGASRVAHADGWIHCSPQKCNASGADGGVVGVGLLLVAGVGYGLGRRKRR